MHSLRISQCPDWLLVVAGLARSGVSQTGADFGSKQEYASMCNEDVYL